MKVLNPKSWRFGSDVSLSFSNGQISGSMWKFWGCNLYLSSLFYISKSRLQSIRIEMRWDNMDFSKVGPGSNISAPFAGRTIPFEHTRYALLGTNISPPKACLKMTFLSSWWDMLVHWRVVLAYGLYTIKPTYCQKKKSPLIWWWCPQCWKSLWFCS